MKKYNYLKSIAEENISQEFRLKNIDDTRTYLIEEIIKKKKKKRNKRVPLAKSKLNRIEVLISKSLIDSNISHDEFVSINNALKEYEEMKEEIKNSKTQVYRKF